MAIHNDGWYAYASVQWQWQAWQAATRAAVPEGWKVVPLEPTSEMIEEGEKAHWSKEMDKMSPTPTEFYDECGGPIGYAWVAMLAAAPEVKP